MGCPSHRGSRSLNGTTRLPSASPLGWRGDNGNAIREQSPTAALPGAEPESSQMLRLPFINVASNVAGPIPIKPNVYRPYCGCCTQLDLSHLASGNSSAPGIL